MSYRRLTVDAQYRALHGADGPVDFRGRSFDTFDLRAFLDHVLPKLSIAHRPWAFEYGTGTGPGACYLAARGFRVDAVDTSSAAIALARRFAAERGVTVQFDVADIAHLPPRTKCYDLVVDSFCLHNVIADADRRRALAAVHRLLAPRGHLVVGTCVLHNAREYGDDIRDEGTGIVLTPLPDGAHAMQDAVQINGAWFYPRVRHLAPVELRAELEAAGFGIVEQDGGRVLCTREQVPAMTQEMVA